SRRARYAGRSWTSCTSGWRSSRRSPGCARRAIAGRRCAPWCSRAATGAGACGAQGPSRPRPRWPACCCCGPGGRISKGSWYRRSSARRRSNRPCSRWAAPAPRARTRVRPRAFTYNFSTENHGRIGVVVNMAANADSDKIGARIAAVTPGGPADKAGLKAGDVITKFNGTALGSARAGDEDESGPGMKLVELAHALDPGDTVKVDYRRGNDAKQATLVAEEVEGGGPFAIAGPEFGFHGMDMPPMTMTVPGGGVLTAPEISICFGESWCSLQLVNLNADLVEYFGSREGVLV